MKTKIKFTRAHIHANVRYAEGQIVELDLADAKQIIAAKSAAIHNGPLPQDDAEAQALPDAVANEADALPAADETPAAPRGRASR